jgi:hypothetical protein
VISIKGKDRSEQLDASRLLWSWIDQHAKQFGVGHPYLNYDPPHVAPIDGKEYAHQRGGDPTQHCRDHPRVLSIVHRSFR